MQKSVVVSMHSEGENALNSDAALVQSALTDPGAFGTLYERYYQRIYRYLLTCTRNVDDAADLTQQVFLRALAALRQYHPQKGSFSTWLLSIAHHTAVNFVKRYRVREAWNMTDELFHASSTELDPENEILRHEALARLHVLFAALDSHKRELLTLRFVSGLTIAEIALVVGKSEAATKKQLSRTLYALKEQYHDTTK